MKEEIFGDIETMLFFLSIIGATIVVATAFNFFFNRSLKRHIKKRDADPTNYQFFKHFLTGLIYLVGVGWAFLVLPPFKTVAHTLLTGAGIMALVAGLASQQVLSNFTSGLFMVMFKPFRIHDRITIREKLTGTVEDITFRHTIIRDLDNNRIIIPNSVMGSEIIVNAHLGDKKVCRKIDIGVSYQSDIDKAFEIMKEEVLKHPLHVRPALNPQNVGHDQDVFTQILTLAESSIILRAWAWANSENDALRMEADLLIMQTTRFYFFAFFFTVFSLTACQEQQAQEEAVTEQKINIIYILADDLGFGDVSYNGQQKFSTPNIDRLAQQGLVFTQHYSGSTVCAPSRSCLMTGLHTGHTPVRGNKEIMPEGQHPLPDTIPTVAKLLQEQGYVTGAFGKWGLGFPGSEGDPVNQGFDNFFGYNCQRMGHNYYPYHLWDNQNKVELTANEGQLTGTYAPALIQEKTLEFIEKNQDKPFFLFVPSIIPHAELAAPEAYMEKFRGKFSPETGYEGVDEGEEYRLGPYSSQKEPHTAFAAMVTLLDEQVGAIVAKVKELGLEEKTLIIFTSDNGPHQEGGADPDYFDSNGPLKGYKRDLYEGGIRVPTIAYWPGTVKTGQTDHISAFWDFLPTVAALTGADIPAGIDGISFLPTLTGEGTQQQHEYMYWEFHERGGRIAIRKGNWKGVRYNVLKTPDSPLELYDLSMDLAEATNVAAQHPEVVTELDALLKQARTHSDVFTFSSGTYLNSK